MHLFYNVMAAGSSYKALNIKSRLIVTLFNMLVTSIQHRKPVWGRTLSLGMEGWYWADISVNRKRLMVFVANSSPSCQVRTGSWKTCVCRHERRSFPTRESFLMRSTVILTNPVFRTLYIMERVNIYKICVTRNRYVPND